MAISSQRKYQDTSVQHYNAAALPASVDWREKQIITAVKDQGN